MNFEQQLNKGVFSYKAEKTFLDKLFSKEDSERIRDLIKKTKLTREELSELLNLIVGTESKLLNYSQWDRYIILKLFVWIREYLKVTEILYDYEDDLREKQEKGEITITPRAEKLLKNNSRIMEHSIKFLIDLYLNIGRTSLSIGATGFLEPLHNKYEISYPQGQGVATDVSNSQNRGLFGGRK